MKVLGLVIMTETQLEEHNGKVRNECRNAIKESLFTEREDLDHTRNLIKQEMLQLNELRNRLWKEVNEAKADLILREMARVMGGHWDGVRV